GARLSAADLILVANQSLTLASNADVEQTGTLGGPADRLLLGNSEVAGSGNGVLVRVSSDPAAQIARLGVDSSTVPLLSIGAGAHIIGISLTLDSTAATTLDPTAIVNRKFVALDRGRIRLQLSEGRTPSGLMCSSQTLKNPQDKAQSLSFLSYSTIDIYGAGTIGALDSNGQPTLASLAFHAGEIRGFDLSGGTANFYAQNILIDNSANG